MDERIKNITLEYLYKTRYGKQLKDVISILNDVQEGAYGLVVSDPSDKMPYIRIGTILMLGILEKMGSGKSPKSFDTSDFAELASKVNIYAINVDEKAYSVFVFELYARYIAYSASQISSITSKEKAAAIAALVDELNSKKEQLSNGSIKEARYIEDCLWICLDAMVKLLSAYAGSFTSERGAKFIDNISSFGFEYGRYIMYKRECELITEYLEKQKIVDDELREKFEKYLEDVEKYQEEFNTLITKAFDSDFRQSFVASIQLAEKLGVSKDEILANTSDVDDYFTS